MNKKIKVRTDISIFFSNFLRAYFQREQDKVKTYSSETKEAKVKIFGGAFVSPFPQLFNIF